MKINDLREWRKRPFSILHSACRNPQYLLLGILLLGFLVRLASVAHWNTFHPNSTARLLGDEPGYDNLAREMLQGYGFTWPGRVPLYPLWLAAVYLLTNGSYALALYVQILPGLATIWLTYLLGRRVLGTEAGLLAGLLAALSYTLIHQSLHYLSEIIYTPLLLLLLLALYAAFDKPSLKRFALAGFLVGASNLTRPTLLLFPIFTLLLFWVMLRRRQAIQYTAVFLIASILTITPWLVRNYARYQAWFPLQTSNAILWQGSPEYYRLIHDEGYTYLRIWSDVLYGPGWEAHDPNSISGDRYWTTRALTSIADEPLVYLRFAGEKLLTYWVGDPHADWNDSSVFNYAALRQIGFASRDAALVMLMRTLPLLALLAGLLLRQRWRVLLPLYALLGFVTLLHAATHAEARLSEPFQPFLLILIAGAIAAYGKKYMIDLVPQTGRWVYLRDLLYQMVARDMKLRYRDSVLGVVWSLLNPLSQLLVFSFVFRYVLPLNIPNYTSFLFIGLLAWSWFQGSLLAAATVIVDGRSLIRRPGFPAVVLPIVSVMANMVHFLLALPIVFVFLWLTGVRLHGSVILLPFIIILQALFTLSLAYFVATFHVSFRDTQHLVGVILFLFFYLTPIFYDPSVIPARFQPIYRLNPALHLVEAYRAILLHGTWPAWGALGWVALATAVLLIIGVNLFQHASYRFVEEL